MVVLFLSGLDNLYPVGGSGEIKVQFDSSNKPGMQNKVVTITANTESKVKKLLIRAQVNPRS